VKDRGLHLVSMEECRSNLEALNHLPEENQDKVRTSNWRLKKSLREKVEEIASLERVSVSSTKDLDGLKHQLEKLNQLQTSSPFSYNWNASSSSRTRLEMNRQASWTYRVCDDTLSSTNATEQSVRNDNQLNRLFFAQSSVGAHPEEEKADLEHILDKSIHSTI